MKIKEWFLIIFGSAFIIFGMFLSLTSYSFNDYVSGYEKGVGDCNKSCVVSSEAIKDCLMK